MPCSLIRRNASFRRSRRPNLTFDPDVPQRHSIEELPILCERIAIVAGWYMWLYTLYTATPWRREPQKKADLRIREYSRISGWLFTGTEHLLTGRSDSARNHGLPIAMTASSMCPRCGGTEPGDVAER